MREDDDDVNKENILGVDSCKNKSRSLLDTLRGVTAKNNVLILQLWVELVEGGEDGNVRSAHTQPHEGNYIHFIWDETVGLLISLSLRLSNTGKTTWIAGISNQATLWSGFSKLAALSAFLARPAQVCVDMRQTATMSVSTFCSDICSDIRSAVLKQSEPFGPLPTVLLDCSAFSCIHCVSILWKLIFGHKC